MIHPSHMNGGADEDFLDAGDPSLSHLPPARIVRVGKARVRVALCRARPHQKWDVQHGRDITTLPTKGAATRAAFKAAGVSKVGAWYVLPTPSFRTNQ